MLQPHQRDKSSSTTSTNNNVDKEGRFTNHRHHFEEKLPNSHIPISHISSGVVNQQDGNNNQQQVVIETKQNINTIHNHHQQSSVGGQLLETSSHGRSNQQQHHHMHSPSLVITSSTGNNKPILVTTITQNKHDVELNNSAFSHVTTTSHGHSMMHALQDEVKDSVRQLEDEILNSKEMHPISCNKCRSRHTKCDRLLPSCSYCERNGHVCIYVTPKKVRKNFAAEFVDLNEKKKGSKNRRNETKLGNEKFKYKVYKFKWSNNQNNSESNTLESGETEQGENHKQIEVQEHFPILDVKLFMKSFISNTFDYYSKYIAFGYDLITMQNVDQLMDIVNSAESLQLFPDDALSLMYCIHALTLSFQEEREMAAQSFEKSLKLLQYDISRLQNNSNRSVPSMLCCSPLKTGKLNFFFSYSNRDSQSLFLIGTRLTLCQYFLTLGKISHALNIIREADSMLDERFGSFRNFSFLSLNTNENPDKLFDGLSKEEINLIKYRVRCGIQLDEIRFIQEYSQYYLSRVSTGKPIETYTKTSAALKDSGMFKFSSFVNRRVMGNLIFTIGSCKNEILKVLLSPIVMEKEQLNKPFLIMGIADFHVKILEEGILQQYELEKVESLPSENEGRLVDLQDYNQILFLLQRIYITSCSLLVLHEVVLNSTQPTVLLEHDYVNEDSIELDMERVEKCREWKGDFANELSDYYEHLPEEMIHFMGMTVVSIFLVARIHFELLSQECVNKEDVPSPILVKRMRSDYRMLRVLKRKFSHLFDLPFHDRLYRAIEKLLNSLGF